MIMVLPLQLAIVAVVLVAVGGTRCAVRPCPFARPPPLLREVIERGWEQDPADRPTMDMVVRWLVQQRVERLRAGDVLPGKHRQPHLQQRRRDFDESLQEAVRRAAARYRVPERFPRFVRFPVKVGVAQVNAVAPAVERAPLLRQPWRVRLVVGTVAVAVRVRLRVRVKPRQVAVGRQRLRRVALRVPLQLRLVSHHTHAGAGVAIFVCPCSGCGWT